MPVSSLFMQIHIFLSDSSHRRDLLMRGRGAMEQLNPGHNLSRACVASHSLVHYKDKLERCALNKTPAIHVTRCLLNADFVLLCISRHGTLSINGPDSFRFPEFQDPNRPRWISERRSLSGGDTQRSVSRGYKTVELLHKIRQCSILSNYAYVLEKVLCLQIREWRSNLIDPSLEFGA